MLEEEAPSFDSRNKVFFYENWSSWKLLEDQRSPAHMQGALALFVYLAGSICSALFPIVREHELVEKILEEIPFFSKDNYGWIELVWLESNPQAASKGDITTNGVISSTNPKYNQGG
jgi:hypothetical protein